MSNHSASSPQDQPESGANGLFRSRENRMVAGVAGGLAEYLDLDPAVVRIGFVAASLLLAGIGGPVLYLLAWAVIPERGQTSSIASEFLHH